MTQLLVSVRNVSEAAAALDGGADLIDLKEPQRGALGRCEAAVWGRVCEFIDGRRPVSAALGELVSDGPWEQLLQAPELPQLQFAKIGLADCDLREGWQREWATILQSLPAEVGPVAVSYVDYRDSRSPPPDRILAAAADHNCRVILFDTFRKQGGLLDHVTSSKLAGWIETARDCSLRTVVAGSLKLNCVDAVLRVNPDFVAVRGGVCRGGRAGQVDVDLVRAFADRLRDHNRSSAAQPCSIRPANYRRFA